MRGSEFEFLKNFLNIFYTIISKKYFIQYITDSYNQGIEILAG